MVTHLIFAECCWFATSAVCDVPYEVPEVFTVAAASMLPDADYPKSWLGHQLGSVSEEINRLFGHRSFLHSLLALLLITLVLGAPLWRITGNLAPAVAIFVGFGSHLFADMMTLGGVQLFWPRQAIAVFPGRDEYRVVTGSGSEAVFIAVAFVLAGLFYPVSRMGFDGLLYRLGGADQVYGKVTKVTDGDTISVEVYGQVQPVRLIGVDTPETVAIGQPVGCYGKKASSLHQTRANRPADPPGDPAHRRFRRCLRPHPRLRLPRRRQRRLLRARLQRGPHRPGPRPHNHLLPHLPPQVRAIARRSRGARHGIVECVPRHDKLLKTRADGGIKRQMRTIVDHHAPAIDPHSHPPGGRRPPLRGCYSYASATWRVPACALGQRVMRANPRASGHQPPCGRPVAARSWFCERSRAAS